MTSAAGFQAADASPPQQRARFAVRGLRSAGFGGFIGVALHLAFGMSLWSSLVHSMCISTMCWFCIDLGRLGVARWLYRRGLRQDNPQTSGLAEGRWPGWPWMLLIIVVGTLIGFSAGNALAGWITGHPSPGFLRGSLSQAMSLLALALVPGIVITYWFYSRERLAAQAATILTAQRQAAEHQLKLLESQLEPHMLFNTLANLRALIGIDPARAQLMLDQLIAFLRASLAGSRTGRHSLGAEFQRLRDYLALMQIRMGTRLVTRFELPPELAAAQLPPLLLQPLVENSIKHGLEPQVAGGRIDVSAAREGDVLVLSVRDSGAGLGIATGDADRYGLAHVRERLATLYGERASFALAPAGDAEGGTLATIRLPFETRSETGEEVRP